CLQQVDCLRGGARYNDAFSAKYRVPGFTHAGGSLLPEFPLLPRSTTAAPPDGPAHGLVRARQNFFDGRVFPHRENIRPHPAPTLLARSGPTHPTEPGIRPAALQAVRARRQLTVASRNRRVLKWLPPFLHPVLAPVRRLRPVPQQA